MYEVFILDNSKNLKYGAMPWLMSYMALVLARLKFLAIWNHYLETLLRVFHSTHHLLEQRILPKQILVSILSPLLFNQQCGNAFPTFFDFSYLKQLFLH